MYQGDCIIDLDRYDQDHITDNYDGLVSASASRENQMATSNEAMEEELSGIIGRNRTTFSPRTTQEQLLARTTPDCFSTFPLFYSSTFPLFHFSTFPLFFAVFHLLETLIWRFPFSALAFRELSWACPSVSHHTPLEAVTPLSSVVLLLLLLLYFLFLVPVVMQKKSVINVIVVALLPSPLFAIPYHTPPTTTANSVHFGGNNEITISIVCIVLGF